jgi:hypothetical protein
MRSVIFNVVATLLLATPATAEKFICQVYQKIDVLAGQVYTPEQVLAAQFSVRLDTISQVVSRCSFAKSAGRVTCDDYRVDRIEAAPGFVDIVKVYYFAGHFDLQIFDGLSFIENNGRGSISIGNCSKI